jgi:hypothetical protein
MLSGEQIRANGACVFHPLPDPQNDWLPEIPIASPTPDLRLDISSPKHSATLHDPVPFQVLIVLPLHHFKMSEKRLPNSRRKHGMPVFVTFTLSNQYMILRKLISLTLKRQHSIRRGPAP